MLDSQQNYDDGSGFPAKALIIGLGAVLIVGGLVAGFFWLYKPNAKRSVDTGQNPAQSELDEFGNRLGASSTVPTLPNSGTKDGGEVASSSEDFYVEYLNFSSYYQAPNNSASVKINDYLLPINVKTAVLNYYDVSRKIDLDSGLESLKRNGFATIESPSKDVNDFYGAYSYLSQRQVPPLITADFLMYYYQQTLKKAFKDVEEALFYDNLWEINQRLFEGARKRYEERLALIGNVNDPILESERLAAAYFAVSLELLKPTQLQTAPDNNLTDKTKFSAFEAQNYSFSIPAYLKVDVTREVDLIRAALQTTKSPVLLYSRNYQEFTVPLEYQVNAKLNNFYLTTKWLNSNFPLFFKDENCPKCALDRDDWRISLTTSSFIAQDLFDNYNLKNKWARIYKVLAFFKGLRSDYTYVYYRDALSQLFGKDSQIVDVFGTANPEARQNLEKFKDKLLTFQFSQIDGRYDYNSPDDRPHVGVKMLAESYWPNSYLFGQLMTPPLGNLMATSTAANNITSCRVGEVNYARCSGMALDIINLAYPMAGGNPYWRENSNYQGYEEASNNLRTQIANANVWQNNDYWSNMKIISTYLNAEGSKQPAFASSPAWKSRQVSASLGAWVNLQVPADKLVFFQKYDNPEDNTHSGNFLDYAYVEPNLPLINELIARTEMINQMFALLKINEEVKSTALSLNDFSLSLKTLKNIIEKELNSVPLEEKDVRFIELFAKQYRVETPGAKKLVLPMTMNQSLTQDISGIRLLVLVQKKGEDLVFAVGPIFNYSENR
jgi:hypothetical protein